jgi:hypothetical protein
MKDYLAQIEKLRKDAADQLRMFSLRHDFGDLEHRLVPTYQFLAVPTYQFLAGPVRLPNPGTNSR